MKLDDRPYGPDATPDEVRRLRAQVREVAPGVVEWVEVSHPTEFSVDEMAKELSCFEAGHEGEYAVLIDLRHAGRPSAGVRARLRVAYSRPRILHAAAYTERNVLLNAAAYFVLNGLGLRSHSVHRAREQALAAIEAERA